MGPHQYPETGGMDTQLARIAEYLPLISTVLSSISPALENVGSKLGLDSHIFSPGGIGTQHRGGNAARALLDAQTNAALNIQQAQETAVSRFRNQHRERMEGSGLTPILASWALEHVHKPALMASYQAATQARAGLGLTVPTQFADYSTRHAATGFTQERRDAYQQRVREHSERIENVFGALTDMSFREARGTALHERGLVANMVHRSSRQDILSGDMDDVTTNIINLTKAFSELADVLGSDVETAVQSLTHTMGADAVAAFSGSGQALQRLVIAQQEATRVTGVSQEAIAGMTGTARESIYSFGRTHTMSAPLAGTLSAYFASAPNLFGIDEGQFRTMQTDITAGAMESRHAHQLAGLFAMMDDDMSPEEFIAEVRATGESDPLAIARAMGREDIDAAALTRAGRTTAATRFRTQSPEAAQLFREQFMDSVRVQTRDALLSAFEGDEGIVEDILGQIERGEDTWETAYGGRGLAEIDRVARHNRMPDERYLMASLAAHVEGTEQRRVGAAREKLQERLGDVRTGDVVSFVDFMTDTKRRDDDLTFGEYFAAFMGASSVEEIAKIWGEDGIDFEDEGDREKLLDNISRAFSGEDGARARHHFQNALADIGKLSEEEQEEARRHILEAMETGDAGRVARTARQYDEKDREYRQEVLRQERFRYSLGVDTYQHSGWDIFADYPFIRLFTDEENKQAILEERIEAERDKVISDMNLHSRDAQAKFMSVHQVLGEEAALALGEWDVGKHGFTNYAQLLKDNPGKAEEIAKKASEMGFRKEHELDPLERIMNLVQDLINQIMERGIKLRWGN